MQIFKRVPQFDFMEKKTKAIFLSGMVIMIGVFSIFINGGLKYGIDFAGGTLVQLKFLDEVAIEDVRDGLKTIGLGESTIQEFGSKNHLLIRVERSMNSKHLRFISKVNEWSPYQGKSRCRYKIK